MRSPVRCSACGQDREADTCPPSCPLFCVVYIDEYLAKKRGEDAKSLPHPSEQELHVVIDLEHFRRKKKERSEGDKQ